MNLVSLAIQFQKMLSSSSPILYVRTDPEILDFTNGSSGRLIVFSSDEQVIVPLDKLTTILGFLSSTVFSENMTVIGWGIKNIFSFLKYHLQAPYEPECNIFDLKILEAFSDKRINAPINFTDALTRLQEVVKGDNWSKLKTLYRDVYLPLITKVIPAIETHGILDQKNRVGLYSCYEIEGQANGRLLCHEAFKRCFNPHSITPEEKECFRPRQLSDQFVLFDFRHMEVSMLQWLSKDEKLSEILSLDHDLYEVIFKLVSGADCDNDNKREMCKRFFLPVVYGMGAATLEKELSLSQATAETIIKRLYSLFPRALAWVQECQKESQKSNLCYDVFGRKRYFKERYYRARDFVVQSPAAVVCLDKLVCLYDAIAAYANMAAHIHDGYLVTANKAATREVADIGREVLQGESKLALGLKLKVSCKVGRSLDALELYEAI
jgi:hypothetical protein